MPVWIDPDLTNRDPRTPQTVRTTVVTVGTSAVQLVPIPLTGRRGLVIQFDEANTADVYIGSLATTADSAFTGGLVFHPGAIWEVPQHLSNVAFIAISTAASQKIRVLESA